MRTRLNNSSSLIRVATRLTLFSALLIIITGIANAFATANTVDESGADRDTESVSANDLKPDECSPLNLGNIVEGSTGTSGNDLLLGSDNDDTLDGGGGNDCIVAGDGDDIIFGGSGNDILLGGSGSDTCTGDAGSDDYNSCETQL